MLRGDWAQRFAAGKTHVVLGGGAMHGLMYLGALTCLFPTRAAFARFFAATQSFAGASMGALLAALLCQWTPWEVWAYTKTEQFRAIGAHLLDQSLLDMPGTCSLSSGRALDAALQRGVADVYGSADVTLADVRARTAKQLIIVVSNLTRNRVEYWSAANRPATLLWQALRASVAIPGIFPPLCMDGQTFVDGGLMCNLPCHLFPPAHTLVLLVHTCARAAAAPPPHFAARVWENFMGAAQLGTLRAVPAYATSCIPCIPTPDTPEAYAFGASDAVVDALVCQGARSVGVMLLCALFLLTGCGLLMKSNAAGAKCAGSSSKRPVDALR